MLTEPSNMLICHTIVNFIRSVFLWLSERSSTLLMLADVRALRHCVNDHLLAISRTA